VRALVCAALCLPAGFGVAELTGVRPIGGVVLVALAALACLWSRARPGRLALWAALLVILFAASHLLGDAVGSWVAVGLVSAVAAAAFVALAREPSHLAT
jgi:hypothetical protein